MNGLMLVVLILVVIGITIMVFSFISLSIDKKNQPEIDMETINATKIFEPALNKIEGLMSQAKNDSDKTLEEIDKTMDELNNTSKAIFAELEEKYQELLFLYSLIDEKKNEVANLYKNTDFKIKDSQNEMPEVVIKEAKVFKNPRLKEIEELKNQGLSISEIAKKLNIGQGEVKLILELEKVR